MTQTLWTILLFIASVPVSFTLLWYVHCALERVCVGHAEKYCRQRGFDIRRVRSKPEFNQAGVKTEYTLVQLDCLDPQNQRSLLELSVSPFGVRKLIRNEPYPEPYDQQPPQRNS